MWKKYLFLFSLIVVFSLLGVRLIDVQLLRGEEFLNEAEDNRFFSRIIRANRGLILDRYGDKLAWNQRIYLKKEDENSLFGQEDLLDKSEALQLMASDPAKVGLDFSRQYAGGESLAHILGYISPVTKEDLESDSNLSSDQELGRMGLEKEYEKKLLGVDGKEVWEIDALAHKRRTLWQSPAQDGKSLQTSIDPYLSEVAWRALGDQNGVVIIGDAKTGEILSLVSKPGFDPTLMSQSKLIDNEKLDRQKRVNSWLSDENKRFFDRAVSGVYPPGSVFKLITSIAGLEKGSLDENTRVIDEGSLKVGDYEYRNWYYRQYGGAEGEMDIIRAIARSNDIFFYKAAEWTTPDTIAEMARRFGFGKATGIELPGEKLGLVPDPAWKESVVGEKWFLGNTYHFGIGQGDILVSPIQVSQMLQALGNNGKLCRVRLLESEQIDCFELGLQQDNLNLVLEGMVRACSPGGTASVFFAHNSAIQSEGFGDKKISDGMIACKTGTAEFGGQDELGRRKTHGWWVGIIDLKEFQINNSNPEPMTSNQEQNLEPENQEDIDLTKLRQKWLEKVEDLGFPERITITVLAESDDEHPFKEGAIDAAKPGKQIIDWILNN